MAGAKRIRSEAGMSRAGLLVNPRSGKSSGKGLALAEKLRTNPAVSVRVIEEFHHLARLIDELAGEGVTDLFISSGDGTIHAIQTELAERQPFRSLPRLALLPHGTTNMTAADLGFRYRGVDAQADFIRRLTVSDLRSRPTLRVVNPRDGRARHGMFLGTGAVAEATLFCQQAFNARGVKGSWATFATLASAVGRSLFTPANPHDPTRFDRPFAIEVAARDQTLVKGTQLLMLATTLQKLILGTRPFWGPPAGPIRATVIPYPVPSIPRWLIPTLYGSNARRGPPGAVSFATDSFAVQSAASYVIDGEFFEGPPGEALRVETGPAFTYVVG
jgi:diacylglycerol kinase (ATP)